MTRPRRFWIPRFSLRTFLIASVFCGSAVAWFAHNYHEYLADQAFIEKLSSDTPAAAVMTVVINGQTTFVKNSGAPM